MSTRETIDKAYGGIPKEVATGIDLLNWIPSYRGIRYYWLKLVRYTTR